MLPRTAVVTERSRLVVLLFALLCFASGAVSLNYQIVWQRVLTQQIGIDTYSVTLIVSLFMAGLGIGGYLGARLLLRPRLNLVVTLAFVEGAMGIVGTFSVPIIQYFNGFLLRSGLNVEWSLLANFVLLLIPTILMGISTPLMVRLFSLIASPSVATAIGYSSNIVGAAAGTLVSGYVLVGTLGLTMTCVVMGLVDVAVALVFLAVGRQSGSSTGTSNLPITSDNSESDGSQQRSNRRLILLASFILGFVALGSEVAYFRLFTSYFGPTPYVFPTLLFAYLVNMAAGNFLAGVLFRSVAPLLRIATLGFLSVLATLLLQYGNAFALWIGIFPLEFVMDTSATDVRSNIYPIIRTILISVVLLLPVAFLSGILPILVSMLSADREDGGQSFASLYYVQTAGNVVGSLVVGFVLYAYVETIEILEILGLATAAAVTLLLVSRRAYRWLPAPLASIVVVLTLYNTDYFDSVLFPETSTDYIAPERVWDDPHGMVMAYPRGGGDTYAVMSGGRFYLTGLLGRKLDGTDQVLHSGVVGFPIAFNPEMKDVLFIGVGTAEELTAFERLPDANVELVELLPSVTQAVRELAYGPIREAIGRVNVYDMDGRRFLMRQQHSPYDYIHIGVHRATTAGAGNLFSREFMQMASLRLADRGIVSFVAYPAVVKAALEVFPEVIVLTEPGAVGIAYAFKDGAHFQAEWNGGLAQRFADVSARLSKPVGNVALSFGWSADSYVLPTRLLRTLLAEMKPATDDLLVTEYYLNQANEVSPGRSGIQRRIDLRVWDPVPGVEPMPWWRAGKQVADGNRDAAFEWSAPQTLVRTGGLPIDHAAGTWNPQMAAAGRQSWQWTVSDAISLSGTHAVASLEASNNGNGRWGLVAVCSDTARVIDGRYTYAEGRQKVLLAFATNGCTRLALNIGFEEIDGPGSTAAFTPHAVEVHNANDPLWRPGHSAAR